MLVALHLVGQGFGSDVHHPSQRITQKVPLVGVQSCNDLIFLELLCFLESFVTHYYATQVGNVFTLGEFAIDVQLVHHDVLVELFHNHFGLLAELDAVFAGPPIAQIPSCIELATLIVEAVGDFMTKGGTPDDGVQNSIVGHLAFVTWHRNVATRYHDFVV